MKMHISKNDISPYFCRFHYFLLKKREIYQFSFCFIYFLSIFSNLKSMSKTYYLILLNNRISGYGTSDGIIPITSLGCIKISYLKLLPKQRNFTFWPYLILSILDRPLQQNVLGNLLLPHTGIHLNWLKKQEEINFQFFIPTNFIFPISVIGNKEDLVVQAIVFSKLIKCSTRDQYSSICTEFLLICA